MKISVESPINETPRVLQVRGIFDLTQEKTSKIEWNVEMPFEDKPWNIGLIVGPSGSGKSTIASKVFGNVDSQVVWPPDQSILDGFPEAMSIKEVVELLSSIGFSSPPAWLRPYQVLSTGQKFRVTLARMIAEKIAQKDRIQTMWADGYNPPPGSPIIFDEFTSVVDRTVAQIGSAALEKIIRKRSLKFVAVTCHEDVEPWLNPDWVYRPAEGTFLWRSLCPRPRIKLTIHRCTNKAWPLFAPHHYLNTKLLPSSICFIGQINQQPVVFSAWLAMPGASRPTKREHRTVCLPDYQGIGIGNAVSDTVASLWTGLGFRATSTTTHPAMIRSRLNSPNWRMRRQPGMIESAHGRNKFVHMKHATTRMTTGFEFIGKPMEKILAKALLGD